jgi:carbon storage regulator
MEEDMVVLSRKLGEKIVIGNNITLTVVKIMRDRVRLAFEAPVQVQIVRAELGRWRDKAFGADPGDWRRP